jgi:hypothetical protein
MSEIDNITNNTNGEIPAGDYTIFRVKNNEHAENDLEVLKQTLKTILENNTLDQSNEEWYTLLPKQFVEFNNQLDDNDFRDELLHSIPTLLGNILDPDIKEWEWYSTKLDNEGFDIVLKGIHTGFFESIIHNVGIPITSIFFIKDGKERPLINFGVDVLSHKTFDRKTFTLK